MTSVPIDKKIHLYPLKRNLFSIFLFLGIACSAYGQKHLDDYDSLLSRLLTRYIEYPDYEQNGNSGSTLLHISYKAGTFFLTSLYCSDKKFQIKNIDSIQSKLRSRFNPSSQENFDIVYQVIFSFDKKKEIPADIRSRIFKEMARLKSKKYLISKSPVWLVIHEPLQ